jgi:6-phosphofructokinase
MGRAASNIALECALLTRPNICLISEEVEQKGMTLAEITKYVAQMIVERSQRNQNYGIILLPEGLIEFIPEFNLLIAEINEILASDGMQGQHPTDDAILKELSFNNRAVYSYLPDNIKQQLLLDRDPHGNVQVAKIETEKLLAQTVAMELANLSKHGKFHGKFSPQFHSYGYEGRSCLPSVFDATYCYALGQTAGAIISQGLNGYICSVTSLDADVSQWQCGGVPVTMMCHMERRHGHMKPVIKKALVELQGRPFQIFDSQRSKWGIYDLYRNPGPIQFYSINGKVSLELPITLMLELNGEDKRMLEQSTLLAREQQDIAKSFGSFNYSPVVGDANTTLSSFQIERSKFKPQLCPSLAGSRRKCVMMQATQSANVSDREKLKVFFPHTYGSSLIRVERDDDVDSPTSYPPQKIGIVFCGRQSPGAHDIVAGILDSLSEGSAFYGFVGGTDGLINGHSIEITHEIMEHYRCQGGFDLLFRTYDRLDRPDQMEKAGQSCLALGLNGLVMIGASRTATDAAYLSEYFLSRLEYSNICVVTVPVAMNDSIKNEFVETTVGFDTASKVTAQIIGNNYALLSTI